jgi:hypothetical protein
MSRSLKKRPFYTYHGTHMKPWRSSVNRRLRHRCKQLINACTDFDNLVMPLPNDVATLWDSPRDGKMHWMEKPLVNDCEWEEFDWQMRGFTFFRTQRENFAKTGHHGDRCNCYHNKRGWYWRTMRK